MLKLNTENLQTLKIHKLTQAQYDRELVAGNIDENALYLTPDEEIDLSPYATIEQLNESISGTMSAANPVGTGSFSMNRKKDSEIGLSSHAEGYSTTASGAYSHAEGFQTVASGYASHTEGSASTASNNYSHAEGHSTAASGECSHTEGYGTTANTKSQHAQGEYNVLDTEGSGTARGKYAHIVGNGTSDTARSNAHTVDWDGNAWFAGDVYVGGTNQDDAAAKKLSTVGRLTEGETAETVSGTTVTCGVGAEIFNDYSDRTFNNNGEATSGSVASGEYSHAEGRATTASGESSHAEGRATTASGIRSHAEGYSTTASGAYSHAEGYRATVSGAYSHAEGCATTASGTQSHAEGCWTTALANQHAQGHYNNTTTAKAGVSSGSSTTATAFVIGNGTESSASNAFRVTYAGQIYANNSITTSGRDYAEFFEWQDLNPNNEDRRGYFVTLDGNKIKIAESNDYILGIVSGQPAVLGNGDEDWKGRYILDDFGSFIVEEFEYEEKVPEEVQEEIVDKETGEVTIKTKIVMKTIAKTGTKYKENPDYDPSLDYVQREDRPEWDAVGMLGVLSVRDDGTCEVNGCCKVAEGGIATASETGYRVIRRINDNIVEVIFR